jgi:hypothetical protein
MWINASVPHLSAATTMLVRRDLRWVNAGPQRVG